MNLQVEQDIETIRQDVKEIKRQVIEKVPDHFNKQDIVRAFFGALVIGLTFLFKGLLIEIGLKIPWSNAIIVVTSTLFILSTQIYFIGYKHIKHPEERPFGQFLIKRLAAIFGIAVIVSFYLLYIFGFIVLVGTFANMIKLTLLLSMPCAIGAAVGDLLKKY